MSFVPKTTYFHSNSSDLLPFCSPPHTLWSVAGRDDDDEGDDDDNGEVAGGESSGASNSQSVSRLSSENIFLFLIVLLSFLLRSPDFVSQMTLALSSFSRTKIGLILKNEPPSFSSYRAT